VTAHDLISRLLLQPHPEGGWYRQTWRAQADGAERPCGSAIYYLLADDEVSQRHRIDATEIWHYYCGDPLELRVRVSDAAERIHVLGPDIEDDQEPQVVVPRFAWQEARTLGNFTLVGCTVSPAFEFSGFELADSREARTP
jgi:uncharacterized protein